MRTPISIELRARSYYYTDQPQPEYRQHSLNALAALELCSAFGKLLAALPEERGTDLYSRDEAEDRYDRLSYGLNALGCLQSALADFAYGEVDQLAELHERVITGKVDRVREAA